MVSAVSRIDDLHPELVITFVVQHHMHLAVAVAGDPSVGVDGHTFFLKLDLHSRPVTAAVLDFALVLECLASLNLARNGIFLEETSRI